MAKPPKDLVVTITNEPLRRHLRRLVRLGIFGAKETEVAESLINDQVAHLMKSGELERIETINERSIAQDKDDQGGATQVAENT